MNATLPFYKICLQRALSERTGRNPRYSIRAFARTIQVDPAALSRFLSGERIPTLSVAQKVIRALDLSPDDEQFFLSSIAQARRDTGFQRMSPVLKAMPARPGSHKLDLERFHVIADWHHYAILELTFTSGFKSDSQWVARELGITATEAKLAIDRLLNVGLLEVTANGGLRKSVGHMTTADKSTTNSALKRRQKQIQALASDSIDNDPIETRSMTSMTMAIDPDKLPIARTMIEEFTKCLCEMLESEGRKQVYELGIALFPLQKKRK